MLETLRITNYALIDQLEVDFSQGFNVLTGETGAGKSIIIGALNLALGARASADTVRDGSAKAGVDAVFRIESPSRRLAALLAENAIEIERGELLLTRTIAPDGRSRAYVNGSLVPISALAAIGDELVDIHGQHEHQSLMKIDRQLDLLDAYADVEKDVADIANGVAHLREMDRAIAALETDDRERARRVEFLRFEIGEIDAAGLAPGEEETLRTRRNLITNAEKICNLASAAYASLYDLDGAAAIDLIDAAARSLEELAAMDESFGAVCQQLLSARATIEEASSEVRGFSDRIEFDAAELETLNQRIAQIGALKRKYGDSIDAILEYRDKAIQEVESYEKRDEKLADMRRARSLLQNDLVQQAQETSRKRIAAARTLDKKVSANLQELGMKGGKFQTRVEPVELCANGIDRIEFMLAANPGEKPKPLRLVASGGEMSRVMLALKAVFAGADKIPSLIFDEIDAGVGGGVAVQVAKKLRDLAQSHQVLCVTHLAQIAAAAKAHYHVAKLAQNGRTATTLARIDKDQRVGELARLLDGSVSDLSMRHARALLKEASA